MTSWLVTCRYLYNNVGPRYSFEPIKNLCVTRGRTDPVRLRVCFISSTRFVPPVKDLHRWHNKHKFVIIKIQMFSYMIGYCIAV